MKCIVCNRKPRKKDKPWIRQDDGINVCPECHVKVLYGIGRFKGR